MSRNRHQWRAPRVLLGVLLGLCAALLCTSAVWAAGGAGAVGADSGAPPRRLVIKPHGYYRHISVVGLSWSSWGQAKAIGEGTFTFQFCVDESCSVSPIFVDPVVVSMSAMKRCRRRLSYTKMELRVEGELPDTSFHRFATKVGSCRG